MPPARNAGEEGNLEDAILKSWAERSAVQRLGFQKLIPSIEKKLAMIRDVLSALQYRQCPFSRLAIITFFNLKFGV